jgi:heptosyltransferase-1
LFGEVKNTILVVKFSALGDVVHALPGVRYLREKYPDHRILWVVKRGIEGLLKYVPFVDQVVVMDPGYSGFKQALARVRMDKPVMAFDFQGLIKSGLFTFLSGASVRAGFHPRYARESVAGWLVNRRVQVDPHSHIVEQLVTIASLGEEGEVPPFGLELAKRDRERARMIVRTSGINGPFIVLLPGAGWPTKRWPVESYAWIAREAMAHFKVPSLVLWGPGEEELVAPLRGRRDVRVAPTTTIGEMMAVMEEALIVVGGDTGPLHIAAALGRPTLGLYGPTYPWRNGPYGNDSLVLEVSCQNKGCYKRKCREECVASIPKEMVWDALKVMIEEELDRQG